MDLKQNFGVAEDPRPLEQIMWDWRHEEVAAGGPPIFVDKPLSMCKHYTPREQDGSSSCCGQGAAKSIETLIGKVVSAHPIYRRRSNFPDQGMYLQDIGNILKRDANSGTCLESADPSQMLNEDSMNLPIHADLQTPIKIANYIQITNLTIDAIAQAIQAHGHCLLIVHGHWNEWIAEVPKYSGLAVDFGHCVVATDFLLYNGKKAIVIEDSIDLGSTVNGKGQRIITEDYLNSRFLYGMYFIPKAAIDGTTKPVYNFKNILRFGMMGNRDVVSLQNILKLEGFFPSALASTGNYLEVTANAVLKFQTAHNVASASELAALAGRRCGTKTIALLNSLYQA